MAVPPPPAAPDKPALILVGSGRVLSEGEVDEAWPTVEAVGREPAAFGFDAGSRFLTSHVDGDTLAFMAAVRAAGGTNVVLERFSAEAALVAIEQHRVTHTQWTVLMLAEVAALHSGVRLRYNLSSHRVAIHRGPCPVSVSEEIIRWWGPILHEC